MAKARGLRGSFGQAEMLKERGVNPTKALPAELLELAIENEKKWLFRKRLATDSKCSPAPARAATWATQRGIRWKLAALSPCNNYFCTV